MWRRGFSILFSLFLVSCGSGPNAPAIFNPRVAAPGQITSWKSVSREATCTPPDNAPLCVEGKMTVTHDGSLFFGGAQPKGRITDQELAALSPVAQGVADEDLTSPLSCESAVSIPELGAYSVSITPVGGSSVALLVFDPRKGRCIRGDEAKAKALSDQLARLMVKYAPQNDNPGL